MLPLLTAFGCAPAPSEPFDLGWSAWGGLLQRHVVGDEVDYAGWDGDGRAELEAIVARFEGVGEAELRGWSRDDQLAFWINAYNVLVVRLALDHYPLESVAGIGPFAKSAFVMPIVAIPATGSWRKTLMGLENDVVRAGFGEPRIHFALNCASKGCPALAGVPWTGATLDGDLDAAARTFLADTSKNRFDPATRVLSLSAIFDWYAEDFVGEGVSVESWVAGYAPAPVAEAIQQGGVTVAYLPYDWSLNGH